MGSKTLLDQVLEERKFLHDVSNQLVVAQGMGGFVLKSIQEGGSASEKDIERLGKNILAVQKMIELVKTRRDILHKMSEELEPS
jgi:archaellum component FlaC